MQARLRKEAQLSVVVRMFPKLKYRDKTFYIDEYASDEGVFR